MLSPPKCTTLLLQQCKYTVSSLYTLWYSSVDPLLTQRIAKDHVTLLWCIHCFRDVHVNVTGLRYWLCRSLLQQGTVWPAASVRLVRVPYMLCGIESILRLRSVARV